MTRIARLFAQAAANPRASLSFREFERLVTAAGYELKRVTGSHRQYRHARVPFVLTISPRGKDANGYQVEQFVAICAEYNLTVED